MTHHVNPVKMIYFQLLDSHSDGQPCTFSTHGMINSHVQYIAISFQCDDVVILQFDWMFLVLGHRTENLNLDGAPDCFSRMRIQAGYETKTLP